MVPKYPRTKLQIVREIAARTSIKQVDIEAVLDALTALAYKGASQKSGFSIPGIGKVSVIKRKASTGYNPNTGTTFKIPAKKALHFSFSKYATTAILGKK